MSSPAANSKPFMVGMLIFRNMTNLDFAAPYEVFARMPNAKVRVLAKSADPVVTDIGGRVLPDATLANAETFDLIFVGGGPGINALLEDEEVLSFLAKQGETAQWITSVCTGSLVLGAAGLLRGYKAATHWTAMEALKPFGAIPSDERVVIDRNRITGGGVTAGIDFALTITKLLHGDDAARSIQLGMEYDPKPPFDSGSPSRAPRALVDAFRDRAAALTAERIALAERIATKRGWR